MTNKYKVPPQIKVRVKSANEIGNGKKAFLSRRTAGDVIFDTVNFIIMIVFTITMLYPLLNTVAVSFNDGTDALRGGIHLWPRMFTFDNYKAVLRRDLMPTAAKISVLRTVIGTALMVFVSSLAGYLVTKKEMWHRQFWYRFLVVTMYFNAGLIPWYLNMSMLGLTDTFAAYIIPGIVSPYNIILVKTYIESIPAEIEESAFMDGASYWMIYRKIIWPLSKPILATIAIFGAVGHWNSFQDSLILNANSPALYTLQHRLNQSSNLGAVVASGTSSSDASALASSFNTKILQYTISMVTIIPILCVYPFMQRYFEKGLMLGAVKG